MTEISEKRFQALETLFTGTGTKEERVRAWQLVDRALTRLEELESDTR